MPLPALDFSDVAGLARPLGASLSVADQPGGGLPALDFSDVAGLAAFTPAKTGQEKAQDIARAAGVDVSPDFGSNVLDRAAADFGKGLATSLPGRLVGTAIGSGEAVSELQGLPASQPLPWLPDLDTVGSLVGEAALFSLVPAIALPGKIAGRALGKVVGSKLAQLPMVSNALSKGAWHHVQLTQKLTSDLIGVSANLFEAAGATTSAAIGFGGLVKVAGGDDQEAFIQGALAGVAVGLAPAFRALKAGAVLKRVTGDRYLEAERALADSLDTGIGAIIGARGLPPGAAARISVSMLDALDPALGQRALAIQPILENAGKGIAGNIPQMRALGKAWEDAAVESMRPFLSLENTLLKRGYDSAYRVSTGFFKSVDSTLRGLGPRGVQLSNLIKRSQDDAGQTFGELKSAADKAMRGVSKADLDQWVAQREAGLLTNTGSATATGLDRITHLYDTEIPEILARHGVPLEGLRTNGFGVGTYVSHYYDMGKLARHVMSEDFIAKAQSVLGKTYDQALALRESLLTAAQVNQKNPLTQVLRSSIDMSRSFNITISEAKALGLPIADNAFALNRYIRQVADRVGFAKNFGADFEKGTALLSDLAKSTRDMPKLYPELIEESVRRVIGLSNDVGDFSQVFSWVSNNVLVPQTLSLAAISQTGQSTNTIAKTGMRHFLRGVNEYRKEAKLFSRGGGSEFHAQVRAQLDEIGNAAGEFLTGAERANGILRPATVGQTSVLSRMNLGGFTLHKTGFNFMDNWNRFAAAYSGRSWMEGSVQKAVRGTLSPKQVSRTAAEFKKLGLSFNDIVRRGALTSEETVRGSMAISNITQFRIRPFELPLYWSSPNAAAFRMLKTFAFNQGKFINTEIFGAARRYAATGGREGSMKPLAFFMAGYPSTGLAIGSVRDIIKGKQPFEDKTPLGAYVQAHMWVGGLGILSDFAKSADSGSRALFAMGAGPGITWGVDFIEASVKSIDDPNHLGRFMTRHMPVPGLAQNVGGLRDKIDDAIFQRNN